MRIAVTGAAGMLGRDLLRAAEAVNHEVVPLARRELDVTDTGAVARRIAAAAPDAVVNCAAYTDVDGAEGDLRAAMAANAEGAGAVAAAAAEAGSSVVYPSSDYVFDGSKGAPYVESDEPRPLSVYAQSKLAGERMTTEANPRHFVVRSAWLFGLAGRNFADTMLRLASDHGEVIVVRDQVGSPTYTGHLAEAIVRLVDTDAYGVHHVAAAGECSWYELALEVFRQAAVDCRVLSCTTEELARPAPRPPYSALATERPEAILLPDWELGLAAYLDERARAA
ncbi:MAG: dTDP-4-dehydrorhamnose reductase [Thermoleophilaceae bacterium]|jgi:dTDP-4-dehydrorhamnose reductase